MRGEMGLSLNPEEPAGKPGEYGGTEPRESGAPRGRGQLTVSTRAAGSSGRVRTRGELLSQSQGHTDLVGAER